MDFLTYGKLLIEVNGPCSGALASWIFKDGMGLHEEGVWWASKWFKRPNPHEGLDLVQYTDGAVIYDLFQGFRVLSPVSGIVVGVCSDFLDQTVWIKADKDSSRLIVLAHINPAVGLGDSLCCGDPVGTISYPGDKVPLHLHLSVLSGLWQHMERLSWQAVHLQKSAHFIYPVF